MENSRPEITLSWLKSTIDPTLMLAGALYWACVNVGSMEVIASDPHLAVPTWAFYCALLLGNFLSFACCLLCAKRFTPLSTVCPLRLASSCLIVLAALLLLASRPAGSEAAYVLSGFLEGFATGFVFVFFAEAFAFGTVYATLLQAGLQIALGALCSIILAALPPIARILFVIVAGPCSNYLIGLFMKAHTTPPPAAQLPSFNPPALRTLLFLSPLFVGLSVGVMRLSLLALRGAQQSSFFLDALFASLGGALLALAALFLYRNKVYEYLYLIGFPLIAIGLATAPLAQHRLFLGLYALLAGLSFFYGLIWALVAQFRTKEDPLATRLAAKTFLALQCGQLVGLLAFLALENHVRNLTWIAIFSILVLVLLIIRVFMAQREIERDIKRNATELGLRANSISIAEKYGLTAKESEVYALLTQGLSTRQIEAELTVSPNTVNSHIRHIFQKLDVHSRSELMALTLKELSAALKKRP